MLSYILRRIGVSILILIAASLLMYVLVAWSKNPLDELYASSSPNKEQLILQRIQWLHLDQPVILRWLNWLGGAARCVVPFAGCDLGVTIQNQSVQVLLARAVGSTLQLVTGATILAIVLGITIGIVSALRQYTGFDYSVTLIAFLFFSLPIFWVAVLLKQYGAIQLNNWLNDFSHHTQISPMAFAVAGGGILLIAILVTSYHVLKAANTNPVNVLKDE